MKKDYQSVVNTARKRILQKWKMKEIQSKQTFVFLYILHIIPTISFIINIPYLLVACGLVECLWWQQLQIQLLPLLAVVIPFIALYLQQKGKIYAGYLFILSLAYYLFSLWQGSLFNQNFLFTFFLIAIVSAQGYLLFKTTYTILHKIPKSKSKKENSPYKDIITIGSIIVVVLILLRLFVYAPAPSSESDCAEITNQEKADGCYISLASSSANFNLCTKVQSPFLRDECYSNSGTAENCVKITVNPEAMLNCFSYQFLWQSAPLDYCDSATNPGLCYFGIAILKEDLSRCTKAYDQKTCETIVKSLNNLCDPYVQTGPVYYEHDVGGVCKLYDPYGSWSYNRPALETLPVDSAECEKITWNQGHEEQSSWVKTFRDQCFTASAIHHNNKETCNLISEERAKWVCVIGAAASRDDCNEIPGNEKISTGDHYSFVRDECYLLFSLGKGDLNSCLQDSDDHEAAWCINNIISRYGADPEQCAAISEGPIILGFGGKRSACYNALAHFRNDPKLCAFIPIDDFRAECIGSIGSIEDCDSISEDEKTEEGNYIRDSCITAMINRDPNVDFCSHSVSIDGFNWCVDLTARITGNKEICSLIKDQQLMEMCGEQATLTANNQ